MCRGLGGGRKEDAAFAFFIKAESQQILIGDVGRVDQQPHSEAFFDEHAPPRDSMACGPYCLGPFSQPWVAKQRCGSVNRHAIFTTSFVSMTAQTVRYSSTSERMTSKGVSLERRQFRPHECERERNDPKR